MITCCHLIPVKKKQHLVIGKQKTIRIQSIERPQFVVKKLNELQKKKKNELQKTKKQTKVNKENSPTQNIKIKI